MSVVPARVPPEYGWDGAGKSPAEIADDIRQTRYRLESDLEALRRKPREIVRRVKAKWPIAAAGAAVLSVIALLVRRIRR
jgi:hypothetical protein